MTAAVTDVGQKIAEWAVGFICDHPTLVGWLIGTFVVATLVNTGIKFTWTYAETPRWARFILGVTMPLAFNFYHIAEKAGVKEPVSPGDVPAASVRAAEKQP